MMHVTVIWGFMCLLSAVRAGGGAASAVGSYTANDYVQKNVVHQLDNLQL